MSMTSALIQKSFYNELLCDDGTDPAACFQRFYTRQPDGSVAFVDLDLGGAAYTLVGNAVCCGDAAGGSDLDTDTQRLTVGGTYSAASNTLHSLSITIAAGTADVNGITLPTGSSRNIEGDTGQNNISTAHTVNNVSADGVIIIVATNYV